MANVSFIGLGVMGFPMAGHLSKNGHDVTVYNRTPIKSKNWLEKYKGFIAKHLKMPVKVKTLFLCVLGMTMMSCLL